MGGVRLGRAGFGRVGFGVRGGAARLTVPLRRSEPRFPAESPAVGVAPPPGAPPSVIESWNFLSVEDTTEPLGPRGPASPASPATAAPRVTVASPSRVSYGDVHRCGSTAASTDRLYAPHPRAPLRWARATSSAVSLKFCCASTSTCCWSASTTSRTRSQSSDSCLHRTWPDRPSSATSAMSRELSTPPAPPASAPRARSAARSSSSSTPPSSAPPPRSIPSPTSTVPGSWSMTPCGVTVTATSARCEARGSPSGKRAVLQSFCRLWSRHTTVPPAVTTTTAIFGRPAAPPPPPPAGRSSTPAPSATGRSASKSSPPTVSAMPTSAMRRARRNPDPRFPGGVAARTWTRPAGVATRISGLPSPFRSATRGRGKRCHASACSKAHEAWSSSSRGWYHAGRNSTPPSLCAARAWGGVGGSPWRPGAGCAGDGGRGVGGRGRGSRRSRTWRAM